MNVSLKNIDATKGIVKLEIVKADYADKVEKSLRSFRQKAEMPGFRKGMVPMGMVKKMYGKHVLVEEINKLVSENLYNYIRETGKSKGFGFVEMPDDEAAKKAIAELNEAEYEGRQIVIKEARPK